GLERVLQRRDPGPLEAQVMDEVVADAQVLGQPLAPAGIGRPGDHGGAGPELHPAYPPSARVAAPVARASSAQAASASPAIVKWGSRRPRTRMSTQAMNAVRATASPGPCSRCRYRQVHRSTTPMNRR